VHSLTFLLRENSGINHGTFLHIAHEEGLITNSSIHAGIRAPCLRPKGDVRNDIRCGFEMVKAREIDQIGIAGVVRKLRERVAGTKVYITVDIDVLDPAYAPGMFLLFCVRYFPYDCLPISPCVCVPSPS
jgi:arginase family enzyme